jgi:polysaccharide biosynthesis protein PslH
VPTVRALCADAYFARLDRRMAKITCLRGLLTGTALSVAFYQDRGLADWVRRTLDEVRPEVIFVCSSNMADYVMNTAHSARVTLVDLADVDSEKWRAYAERDRFPMRWVHRREWRLVAELETRIARECDWSTFVSTEEAQLLAAMVPDRTAHIRAVGSGVDHLYFDPALPHAPAFDTSRRNYVFTGTMDYPPNVDAVLWFAEAILPLIRLHLPDAQFHVVGSSPAPSVQKLAALPGVFVSGRVPDVRPYLAHATAAVAPMRIARGIQNKVLEAMAMARPVVVTPDALEGIDAAPGREVLVATDAATFAAACVQAATPAAAAIAAAARQRVLAAFIWAEKLRGFDELLGLRPPARPDAPAETGLEAIR